MSELSNSMAMSMKRLSWVTVRPYKIYRCKMLTPLQVYLSSVDVCFGNRTPLLSAHAVRIEYFVRRY